MDIAFLGGGKKRLKRAVRKLDRILQNEGIIMADLTNITREVSEIRGVVDSAVALLEELAGQIRANATDEAALNDLADSLDAKAGELGAAVAANTPSA